MLRHYPSTEKLREIVEKGMGLTLDPRPGADKSSR
jgi:hypothetical protein